MTKQTFRSGFVAILGKPNVGKSTFFNALLKENLAIVTPRPQTTRNNIRGILTLKEAQIIFVDTPGLHRPKHLLGEHMVASVKGALVDVDVALLMIDATEGISPEDEVLCAMVQKAKKEAILIINKVDLLKDKKLLLSLIGKVSSRYSFREYIPISATGGDNVQRIIPLLIRLLPEGSPYYPTDQLTDKTERFIAAEFIRKRVLEYVHEEVPHAVAVIVEEMKDRREGLLYIKATMFVEKPTQKAIIIGKDGKMLKSIGKAARLDLEGFFNKKIYLDLWVKARKGWKEDKVFLKRLGV